MTTTPPNDLEGLDDSSFWLHYSPSIQDSSKRTSVLSRESPTFTINEIDRHKSPSGTLSSILLLNEDQTTSTPRVLSHHLDSGQSTLGMDISPHTSQSHIATPQPDPTQLNQIPNSTLSNSTLAPPPSQHQPASRPRSIAELAELAKQSLGDEPRPFKTWLRTAENARRDAKTFEEQGNLELAFVVFAKAAMIVLEKIPFHPEYRVLLSRTQRVNMNLHGQEILDDLAEIKITIMRRYEQWGANPPSVQVQSQQPPAPNPAPQPSALRSDVHPHGINMSSSSLTRSVAPATSASTSSDRITAPLPDKPSRIPVQPTTTTSQRPPHLGTVQYPSLMSQHQISQGYHPSLGSMFHRPSGASHPDLQIPDLVARGLKSVSFPRDCLNRFTSIASINTAQNRGTCGLLLGRDKGGLYVVTTLLVPKQHSTGDPCSTSMDEEFVVQFTEERSLITLGWIHTHPTQSCFMSSVDLHTHSGLQRMLPESFAVVCAPNSTPNFGIFRLTDPPGLQAISECDVRNAFHPHPERPIYTDADREHVQIRDLALEIVDLR